MVIARNSTFIYKGKSVKVQQVGQELGVQYVLKGSVRKDGGHHVWAERYDGHLTDVFAVQDEITVKIMWAMQSKLTEGKQACEWIKHGSENIEAYEKKHERNGVFSPVLP